MSKSSERVAEQGSALAKHSRAQHAAKASWLAPLVVVIFNFVVKSSLPAGESGRLYVIALFSVLIYLVGLGLAVFALSRVRSAGKKGVVIPACVGLALNGLFLFLIISVAITSFNAGRRGRVGDLGRYAAPESSRSGQA